MPAARNRSPWPAIAAAIALWSADDDTSLASRVGRWAPALVASLIIVPLIYAMGLTLLGIVGPGGVAVGALVPVVVWLIARVIDQVFATRRWQTALAMLAIGLGVVGLSRILAGRAEFPIRSVVAYAQDADGTDGWLLTAAPYAGPGSWNRQAIGPAGRTITPEGSDTAAAAPRWLTRVAGRPGAPGGPRPREATRLAAANGVCRPQAGD